MQWCSSSAEWHSTHLLLLHYINPISVGSRQTDYDMKWNKTWWPAVTFCVTMQLLVKSAWPPLFMISCRFDFALSGFRGYILNQMKPQSLIWWLIKGIRILSLCKYKAEAIWKFNQPSIAAASMSAGNCGDVCTFYFSVNHIMTVINIISYI